MYKDNVEKRYPLAKIQDQRDKLIYELSKAEDEEDMELSMLRLHYENKADLEFFSPREKEKVRELLLVLIEDTQKHRNLLGKAVKDLKEKMKS